MGRNEYDGEFDRSYEKGRGTGKGKYGRVVVWPPEAATSDTEVPESVAASPEERPAYPGEAESASLGRGGKIPFLTFTGGERQRARGDVWDIRARRSQDILLAVLIWIVLALVEMKYGVLQFAWTDFASETEGLRGGWGAVILPWVFLGLVLLSLANNGVVLDRRSGTAWFWFGLFGLKHAKAAPFELLEMNIRDNVEEAGAGGGRAVTLFGPERRMRVFRGDNAQAKAYRGRLEAFFAGQDMDFEYKGTMTQRDTLGWFVAGFCILVALLLEYMG